MKFKNTLSFAQELDKRDPLKHFRHQFYIPHVNGKPSIYFCGNSLGLQPKTAESAILQELKDWKELGVKGHLNGKNPWMHYHKFLTEPIARLVGAKPVEVVAMNSLTANLHFMMVSFYRPTKKRYCIIVERGAFPSDQYAVESQAKFHGFDPNKAIIELIPREGELTLRTEDIISTINKHADKLALLILGGVNYYTGQAFDIKTITKTAHEVGANAGFDLAHAAGNLKLELHDWNVDFAVWCTYKYLNSGPGGTSGVFVHEQHATNKDLLRFAGWWGHEEESRFLMKKGFKPMKGAAGWQVSNAQIFPMAIHKAALEIFDDAGMDNLINKSKQLTGFLEFLILELNKEIGKRFIQIITPSTQKDRGCQLSLIIATGGKKLFDKISKAGIIADWREPDVIRIAPVPLYNNFEDVYKFYQIIKDAILND